MFKDSPGGGGEGLRGEKPCSGLAVLGTCNSTGFQMAW
jgi:hypothetical protein